MLDIEDTRKEFIRKNIGLNTLIYGSRGKGKTTMAVWESLYLLSIGKKVAYFVRNSNRLGEAYDIVKELSLGKIFPVSEFIVFSLNGLEVFRGMGKFDRLIFDDSATVFTSCYPLFWSNHAEGFSSYIEDRGEYEDRTLPNILFLDVAKSNTNCFCPRCSTALVSKVSHGLSSGPINVMKCPKCQYCN